MGNFNSNVTSSQTAFNAITTWMSGSGTGQLNMTLVDTVTASKDLVYSTQGASGARTKTFIRVTLSVKDEAPGDSGAGAWDNVTFRLYRSWNTGTHSGDGEAGRFGPSLLAVPNTVSLFGSWFPANSTSRLAVDTWPVGQNGGNVGFDGRRFWYNYNTNLYAFDFVVGTEQAVTSLPSGFGTVNLMIYTVDPVNGRDYLWFWVYTTTPGASWWKYDIAQSTFTAMVDVPWYSTASPNAGQICWDGGDKIYLLEGLQGTSFAYYSIANNVWTALTSRQTVTGWAAAGANTCAGFQKMLYVPAALSGNASDQIFMLPAVGTYDFFFIYNVTGNSWNAGTALPITTYTTVGGFGWCLQPMVGTNGTIYFWTYVATEGVVQLYAWDIHAATWTGPLEFNSTAWWSQPGSPQQMVGLRTQCGKLCVPTTNAQLNLQGVASTGGAGEVDNIAVVATWIIPGTTTKAQRFAYVGYYNSYRNQHVFTLSSSATAGTNAVLTFTALTAGQVSAGDFLEIFDPTAVVTPLHGPNELTPTPIYGDANPSTSWTPGGGELVQVVSVNISTHQVTVASLLHNYGATTTVVGQAPCPAVVTNDCGAAITMSGPRGYQADGHADTYKLLCVEPQKFSDIIDPFNISVGFEFRLCDYSTTSSNQGIPGELFSLIVAPSSAVPGNTSQQEAQQYAIVMPYSQADSGEARNYQIGILNA